MRQKIKGKGEEDEKATRTGRRVASSYHNTRKKNPLNKDPYRVFSAGKNQYQRCGGRSSAEERGSRRRERKRIMREKKD